MLTFPVLPEDVFRQAQRRHRTRRARWRQRPKQLKYSEGDRHDDRHDDRKDKIVSAVGAPPPRRSPTVVETPELEDSAECAGGFDTDNI